jgi:hypothetical protein
MRSDAINQEEMKTLVDSLGEFFWKPSLVGEMANQSNFLFVVVVSPMISDDMKLWVSGMVGKRHWKSTSFLVLASLSEKKVYYSSRTPAFGAAYYRGLRRFAEQNLNFWALSHS